MPQPKNARLLIPDPDNEPDFYTLSKLFPLADQAQDATVIPSASKKHSSSTQFGQSPSSSSGSASNFAFAKQASVSTGKTTTALKHPIVSASDPVVPYNTVMLPKASASVTSALDPDQRLLMLAVALEDEQARLYENAMLSLAFRGSLARNNGLSRRGFPFL